MIFHDKELNPFDFKICFHGKELNPVNAFKLQRTSIFSEIFYDNFFDNIKMSSIRGDICLINEKTTVLNPEEIKIENLILKDPEDDFIDEILIKIFSAKNEIPLGFKFFKYFYLRQYLIPKEWYNYKVICFHGLVFYDDGYFVLGLRKKLKFLHYIWEPTKCHLTLEEENSKSVFLKL